MTSGSKIPLVSFCFIQAAEVFHAAGSWTIFEIFCIIYVEKRKGKKIFTHFCFLYYFLSIMPQKNVGISLLNGGTADYYTKDRK